MIVDYDPTWPKAFRAIACDLRQKVGDDALRIDHIGSTAVPGLAAKPVIDIQVTVGELSAADAWPDDLLPGLERRTVVADHVPTQAPTDPSEWTKRYWSRPRDLHVHVREDGRRNQRYALLFREYLRADDRAAAAYAEVKRALVTTAPGDWDAYYAIKDPVCDLIIAGAEQWAILAGWTPPPSDA